jgi:hypothetical protein
LSLQAKWRLAASAVAALFISQLSTLSIRSISANCCRRNEEGLLKVMGGSMYVRVICHGGARTTLNIYTQGPTKLRAFAAWNFPEPQLIESIYYSAALNQCSLRTCEK